MNRKVKVHAIRSKVLHDETVMCLSYLISKCEEHKDEDEDAKEIFEVFQKHPKVLAVVTAHAIAYALSHKEYIPTIKLEGTVNEDGEVTSVKPDRPNYLT